MASVGANASLPISNHMFALEATSLPNSKLSGRRFLQEGRVLSSGRLQAATVFRPNLNNQTLASQRIILTGGWRLSANMLSITAWTWQFTFTVCLAANADFELPGGLFGIFGFGKGLSKAEAPLGSRFLAVRHYRADESASDKRDDLRAQFEVRIIQLGGQLFWKLKRGGWRVSAAACSVLLPPGAHSLTHADEARRIKELVEAVKVSASNGKQSLVTECEILKIGPLTFVTNVSAPFSFAFHYRGSEQVLCAASPVARDSWIDALSEAWFCRHTGLKGKFSSATAGEALLPHMYQAPFQAFSKQRKPPPKEAEKSPKAAVNVDFSVDDRRQFLVKVNGLEQPIGEYMAFDVEKFTKQGGQPQEQAVSQAAADVSKRALKVTERIKEAASHQPSPLHKEAETESPDELEDASTEEPGSSDEERGESQEEEATNDERLEGQNDEDVDMD
ncbi:hypothetical protein Efla_003711 [Eimeria flavescens]